jgi:hypothetical protein
VMVANTAPSSPPALTLCMKSLCSPLQKPNSSARRKYSPATQAGGDRTRWQFKGVGSSQYVSRLKEEREPAGTSPASRLRRVWMPALRERGRLSRDEGRYRDFPSSRPFHGRRIWALGGASRRQWGFATRQVGLISEARLTERKPTTPRCRCSHSASSPLEISMSYISACSRDISFLHMTSRLPRSTRPSSQCKLGGCRSDRHRAIAVQCRPAAGAERPKW